MAALRPASSRALDPCMLRMLTCAPPIAQVDGQELLIKGNTATQR